MCPQDLESQVELTIVRVLPVALPPPFQHQVALQLITSLFYRTSAIPRLSQRTMATAHPNHASLVEFGQKHVTKGLGRQVEAVLTKASGSYVSLSDGREMLDFTTGIGVTNLGECLANFVLNTDSIDRLSCSTRSLPSSCKQSCC